MKKKNLLTLGALCLSLGLVVSSCNQTTPGTPGEPGKPGEDGQPGKDGVDGKTYKDVIVINDNNIQGGSVKQDVYFVTEGEHDKVTFTFTPKDETKNLLVYFEINGEPVTDFDPASSTYTISDADVYDGTIQVTGAVWNDATSYGQSLLENALEEITDKDHLIFRAPDGTKDDKGVNALYANATFADDSLFDKLAELKGDVEDAVNDLEDSATATEKLEAAKKAAQEGVTVLQNEYKLLVDNTKSLAPSMVDDLIEGVTNEKYTEEDSTKDVETAKAAIEAATTLEEISKVVNEHACKDGTKVIFAEGTLTTLTLRKQTALEALQDAYETLIAKENWLDPEANKNAEEAYDAMVTLLAQYGVSVDTLPGAVYEEYASKVSAATELPLNDKNEIALQKEGVDAINDTYDGVKEKLVEGIVASYAKEIDDAKSLSSSPNAKVTLKGVVEGTVSNFVNEDKDNSKTIESYVDATSGLIGRIEIALENAVVANGLQAFKAERIENAVADALETLNAQAKEIAANDPLYGSIFGAPVYEGQKLVGFKSVANVLTWDKEYANPYLATGKAVNDDGYVEVGADLGKDSVYSKVENSNPSLYASIVSTYEGQLKSCANVAAVKQNLQEDLTRQSARYKDVVADFKTKLGEKYLPKELESSNYVTVADITTTWTNNKLSTMEDLASAAEGLQTAGKALGTLDKKVHAFVTAVEEGYEDFFNAEENNVSTFKEAFDDMVDDIISGEATVSTVNRFTTNSNLTSLYDADVANFLSETKNWLNQKYQNLISNCTVQDSVVYGKKYNELLSFIGHKVVAKDGTATGYVIKDSATSGAIDLSCKTITSITAFIDLTNEVLVAEENPRQLTISQEAKEEFTSSTQDLNTVASNITNTNGGQAQYKTEEELKTQLGVSSLYTKVADVDFEVTSITIGGVTYEKDTTANISLGNNVFLQDVMFRVTQGALYIQTASLAVNATTNPEVLINDGSQTLDISSLKSTISSSGVDFTEKVCFSGDKESLIEDTNNIEINDTNNTQKLYFEISGLDSTKTYKALIKTVLNDDPSTTYYSIIDLDIEDGSVYLWNYPSYGKVLANTLKQEKTVLILDDEGNAFELNLSFTCVPPTL